MVTTMTLPLRPNPANPLTITTAMPPLYWDIKQAAHAFNVSTRTINNWKDQGLLPYLKIGGTIRFDVEQSIEAVKKFSHHEEGELWAESGWRKLRKPRKKKAASTT